MRRMLDHAFAACRTHANLSCLAGVNFASHRVGRDRIAARTHRRVRWLDPAVSRWASVRLPLATFPQAPLRSRTVGFPESGSDLGFPSWAFPVARGLSAGTHTPRRRWFTQQTRPRFEGQRDLGSVSERHPGPPSAQSPFASPRCYRPREASSATSEGITPPSSLLRAHAPDLLPSTRLRHCLVRMVFAGCCQPLLGTGPSRRYLCRSFPTCLDPYPGGSQGACARFFPQDIGLPRVRTGSARRDNPTATSVGSRISGLQSFSDVQARRFARHPGSSHLAPCDARQPWLLHPRLSRVVTSPRSGHAIRPNPGN